MPGTTVEVSLTASGLDLVPTTIPGPVRLDVHNDSTTPAGIAVLELAAGTSGDALQVSLDDPDVDLSTVIVANLGHSTAIEPGGSATVDVDLPSGDFAVVTLDSSGAVLPGSSTVATFFVP